MHNNNLHNIYPPNKNFRRTEWGNNKQVPIPKVLPHSLKGSI